MGKGDIEAIASAASLCTISAAMVVVEKRAKLLFCCIKCDLNPDWLLVF